MESIMKESKKTPKLTGFKEPRIPKIKETVNLTPKKWNLNILLLILFIFFLIFFLYNCKYGIFKSIQLDPYAFNS
jgi:hypothetical protein